MNIFKRAGIRIFQGCMYIATFFLNFREPKLVKGIDSLSKAYDILKEKNINDVLIVTDQGIAKLGLIDDLVASLKEKGVKVTVYSEVVANPTIENVENGLKVYKENDHHAIIAVGGGSAMDCAKMIGARSSNPKKSVQKMRGVLTVPHKLPLFIAVPTTAGTGSECTLAAVIVDEKTRHKYPIEDPHLIPQYAILDPSLLVGLPGHITSTTGMDALTHAVEAFIGRANTRKTKRYAKRAVQLIFENLEKSYNDPKNLELRNNMQEAAYCGGIAFTRAYVGSVHATAHALGGKYNVPHGLANAVILPMVLRRFGKKAFKKLALLSDLVFKDNEGLTNEQKANKFIDEIDAMNKRMNITNSFGNLIKEDDISELVNHAYKEAIPLYPTPILLDKKDYKDFYKHLMENK